MIELQKSITHEQAASEGMWVGRVLSSTESREMGVPYRRHIWVACPECHLERLADVIAMRGSQRYCRPCVTATNNPAAFMKR